LRPSSAPKASTGSYSVRKSTALPSETCRRPTSHRTSCPRGRQTASSFWPIVWALDTAEDLTLIAEEGGELVAEARCRIAAPASLVAMKLQSAPKRRAARAEKAGGDYLDLFRLTSHPDMTRAIAEALRQAPHDLGSWCQREIRRCMVDEADRTVGTIVRSGVGESNIPRVDQMRRIGQSLEDLLRAEN